MRNTKAYKQAKLAFGADRILDIETWHTPATDYPRGEIGAFKGKGLFEVSAAAIKVEEKHYAPGLYRLEWAVDGKDYFYVHQRIPITCLGIYEVGGSAKRPRTWMVDDPLHWYAAKKYLDALPGGNLLVAGLGLGLVLHHALERKDFERILVVERNVNVALHIGALLPPDPRREILIADYYDYLHWAEDGDFDSVYWDLAQGTAQETRGDFELGRVLTAAALPSAVRVFHGLKFSNDGNLVDPLAIRANNLTVDPTVYGQRVPVRLVR